MAKSPHAVLLAHRRAGKARAAALSPEERTDIARRAAAARWVEHTTTRTRTRAAALALMTPEVDGDLAARVFARLRRGETPDRIVEKLKVLPAAVAMLA